MKKLILRICLIILIVVSNINVFADSDAIVKITCDKIISSTVKNESSDGGYLNIHRGVMLRSGISGNSLYFDGAGAYLKGNSTKNISAIDKWTASIWIKPNIGGAEGILPIAKNEIFSMYLNKKTKNLEILGEDSSIQVISNYTFNDDVWKHIVLSYDLETLKLYIDGKLDNSCLSQNTDFFDSSNIFIGRQDSSFYKGCIDEITVYAECLPAADIANLYKSISQKSTDWDFVAYPLKSQYPNGIQAVDYILEKESEIVKPIDTGYEERNEINAVKMEDYNGQLKISEEKYNGKFALEIIKKGRDIIPVKESEYFKTSDYAVIVEDNIEENIDSKTTIVDENIAVVINDKFVIVEGVAETGDMATILVMKGEEIAYINQAIVENGKYKFEFLLKDYGTYSMNISGSSGNPKRSILEITNPDKKLQEEIVPVEGIETKCNFFDVMLKPMYLSEELSFYTKAMVKDSEGNIAEKYVIIKSDNNGDGVFKVGEDFSRGKWQKVKLSLLDVDEVFENGIVSGLYVSANNGSHWIFDNITSGYKKINETNAKLSDFARNNVIYTPDGIKFAEMETRTAAYNSAAALVTGGVSVSENITGIDIVSDVERASGSAENIIKNGKTLYSDALMSEKWAVNDVNYDETETGVSKKADSVFIRNEIPGLKAELVKITLNENEKRIRLLLSKGIYTYPLIITKANGETITYNLYEAGSSVYTEWFDQAITLQASNSSYYASYAATILRVEYEEKESTKEIFFKAQGSAVYTLNNNATADRVTVKATVAFEDAVPTTEQTVQLGLYEGESTASYYSTKISVKAVSEEQLIKAILPKLKANTKIKFTNLCEATSIKLLDFKVHEIIETDWNSDAFCGKKISGKTFFDGVSVSDSITEENSYAVINKNAKGIANTGDADFSYFIESGYNRYKFVNLNTTPAYVKINNVIKWLEYGECFVEGSGGTVILPPNQSVIFVSAVKLDNSSPLGDSAAQMTLDGLDKEYIATLDNSRLYYVNHYDNSFLYCYDFTENTKDRILEISVSEIYAISEDETILVFKGGDNKLYLLDLTTKAIEEMGEAADLDKVYINAKNEIYVIQGKDSIRNGTERAEFYLYQYADRKLTNIMTMFSISSTNTAAMSAYANISFDSTGEVMVVNHYQRVEVYKKINGMWQSIKKHEDLDRIKGNIYISDDLTTLYYLKDNLIDFDGKTAGGEIIQRNDDGTYITNQGQIYDSNTGELYKLFSNQIEMTDIHYSAENDILFYVLGGFPHRIKLNRDQAEAKFALSFDGKNNWYSYLNGRWLLVSEKNTPTETEMYASGMTAKQVNEISPTAFGKLYKDGDDILTVDFAILMNSSSNTVSPVIKRITVKTIDDNDLDGLYGVNIETFKKDDYRAVNSIFPVESFTSGAECYYILSLGNDWLYTYKNGKIAKLVESADELLDNMAENWISFKQYGMTAKELRNIPQEVLNELLVNENYANTEFGIIYVVKTKSDSTAQYRVTFKLQTESKYITRDDIVVEIILNGNDVKVIDSKEFSKDDIEDFVAWVEARQSGSGDVFYMLKNDDVQYFVNYYMINSINVYDGEKYRTSK